MLERGLASDPRIEVIGTAMDADEAEEKIRQLRPDVVTLDVEMPRLNGIDFLRRLMPRHPVPVIVVSSLPIRVLDALEAGAVDFVRKRDANSDQNALSFLTELRAKVKIASMARVRHKAPTAAPADPPPTPPPILKAGRPDMVIAMGSTAAPSHLAGGAHPATTPACWWCAGVPQVLLRCAERLNGICKMWW